MLALGDSITNGGDGRALGVPGRSWCAWLAGALAMELDNLAFDGALADDVLALQVPLARGPYALACVYAGVNDVRGAGWDAGEYERALGAILERAAALAERVLVATIPLELGRPPAGSKVADANAIVRRLGHSCRATVAELEDLGGRALVLPDRVHPTPLGQLEIADRAAAALGAAGVAVARRPSSLAALDGSAGARLRFAAVLAREEGRDLLRLLRECPSWTLRTGAGRRG